MHTRDKLLLTHEENNQQELNDIQEAHHKLIDVALETNHEQSHFNRGETPVNSYSPKHIC